MSNPSNNNNIAIPPATDPLTSSPSSSVMAPAPPSSTPPPPLIHTSIPKGKAWVFGGGSSREQAPVALKYAGIAAVIAESFARIFYRNAFTIGLPALEIPNIKDRVVQGDELKVEIVNFSVEDLRTREYFSAKPVPDFMRKVLLEGGLVE